MLDSSVLVPRWSRVVLQQLAVRQAPPFIPAWSEWIIAETWRTLAWQWLNRVPIWQTAVVAGAHYVVSQNTHDFPPPVLGRHVYGGVEYLTAIEFIEDVLRESAAAVYGAPLPAGASVRSHRVP